MTKREAPSSPISNRHPEAGFSLPELLLVLALMAIFITFAGPAFTQSYRAYKVRSAMQELSVVLRAARQVAVSTRSASSVVFDQAAGNYSWTDAKGRNRVWSLPPNVVFVSASPTTITFTTNGTVSTGNATVVLQTTVDSTRADQWTLDLNTVGRITSTYAAVAP